jgi:hypothetical protein
METAVIYEVEQLSFDYGFLSSEERILVKQKTSEIKTNLRKTAQVIWETGQKLDEVKSILGHGHFGAWLKAEFQWTERTAQIYMAIYRKFESEMVADLNASLTALKLLTNETEEVQEAVLEAGKNGTAVTPKLIKAVKAEKERFSNLTVGDYVLTCRDMWAKVTKVALSAALIQYEGGMTESLPFADIKEILKIPETAFFDGYNWISSLQKQIYLKGVEVLLGVLIDETQPDGKGTKTVGVQLKIKTTGEVITALNEEGFTVPTQCLYDSAWWIKQGEIYLQAHKEEISVDVEPEPEEAPPPKPFAKGDICRTDQGTGRVLAIDKQGTATVLLEESQQPVKVPKEELKKLIEEEEGDDLKRAHKVDSCQGEAVKWLRSQGYSVLVLSGLGKGCPDLLVARDGQTFLAEIKAEKGKLTLDQERFFGEWKGAIAILRPSPDGFSFKV